MASSALVWCTRALVMPLSVAVMLASSACVQPDPEDARLDDYASSPGAANGAGGGTGSQVPGAGGNGGGDGSTSGGGTGAGTGTGTGTGTGGGGGSFGGDCAAPWEEVGTYHPPGYDAAAVHGLEAKLNQDSCASCHGDALTGCAKAPSCDNCHDGGHPAGWRTNCIYCHGGNEDDTGAPPRDIDGTSDASSLSFAAHTEHVTRTDHPAYDCSTCHVKPTEVTSSGHMFDDTPGQAEVTLAGGLSPSGVYEQNGACANLYCHGNGRSNGSYEESRGSPSCSTCHASTASGLSEGHRDHHDRYACVECHGNVVDSGNRVIAPDAHVNGKVDAKMETSWDGSTCTGACHGEFHFAQRW